MTKKDTVTEAVDQLTKEWIDKGKIVEAGFAALRLAVIPTDAPEVQVSDMRMAFFAGAQHLFASIVSVMESGTEPTADDLRRMDLIEKELAEFAAALNLDVKLPPRGRQ